MLYPKNNDKKLSSELFKNPTSEYRGTPFWSWNCKLDKDMLMGQIDQLKEMGMGGFHMHSRSGMATEYLSDEFMDLIKASNEKAKENNMLSWVYDEDRWPSGAAGGLITKENTYRSRFLVFTTNDYKISGPAATESGSTARANRSNNRTCLGKYEVILKDGYMSHYRKLSNDEQAVAGANVWYAHLEISGNSAWFNNQAYVDTLNPEAIKKFVEVTHERYYEVLGDEFGKSVPAIFTDEPQFSHKQSFGYAEEDREIILPFTDDFEKTYQQAYGESLVAHLPELFWELPNGEASVTRYRYHDHISERFASAFADTIGSWCKAHGVMMTGHMMAESTLESQTRCLGDAMRSYRAFQLPGIDILSDKREFTTAKQAQSAAHQYGCPGVLSELYGVTNWDFDFRGHKMQGDWQAALGITVRVHHLTWVSMGGEAKRDYPACIGYQSPWYKEYPLIEDHFGRLGTAMTRGKTSIKVAVIHPVESYWLHWGPQEQTSMIREELESKFDNITNWLLLGLIDFDYICESLLPSQANVEQTAPMKVGEMAYDVIIVPGCETLRSTTLERLEAFASAGGKVIFLGEAPSLVDAVKSDRAECLAKKCMQVPFTRNRVLQALETYRQVDIRDDQGARTNHLLHQMRVDGDNRWLFICHAYKMTNPDIATMEKISIRLKGSWKPVVYDTMTGETYAIKATLKGGETWIEHEFSQHGSLLLCLEPAEASLEAESVQDKTGVSSKQFTYLQDRVPVTLSEPNVLLLDMAQYRFDNGQWQPREELLRVDNAFRKELKYPLRMEAWAQPWVNPVAEVLEHTLSLKFMIQSDVEVAEAWLALENEENTEIILNGVKINKQVDGWFVDESIKKVKLSRLPKGESELLLNIAYGSKTNIEWYYLLGDFGVKVEGSHAKLIAPVTELSFGDWVHQGLPFYAGNVTYHCKAICEQGALELEASHFRSPLLSVALDGVEKGKIAFAPYKLNLGNVAEGEHKVDITAYGNRVNTFGTVHNSNRSTTWFGPNAWRTTGSSWAYEYQLRETGVLTTPRVYQ
jgi:hypothetical protein